MAKRSFDILLSIFGLFITLPLWLTFSILIFLQDFRSPFYVAPRMGKGEKPFKMIKLRSMVVGADKSGVDSTSNNDSRITVIGSWVRKLKADELPQLFNVLLGQMSLVGPRPNVKRGTDVYTKTEKEILSVRPGITDFASIVFSDEGAILGDKKDPDAAYDELIRPWKSRLALLYVKESGLLLDIQIIFLTVVTLFSKPLALKGIGHLLGQLNANDELVEVARRTAPLYAAPPPGAFAAT